MAQRFPYNWCNLMKKGAFPPVDGRWDPAWEPSSLLPNPAFLNLPRNSSCLFFFLPVERHHLPLYLSWNDPWSVPVQLPLSSASVDWPGSGVLHTLTTVGRPAVTLADRIGPLISPYSAVIKSHSCNGWLKSWQHFQLC